VSAQLPDASPDTMATWVAPPLERQFAQVPGEAQTTSSSALGITTIVVQFDLDRNIDAAANESSPPSMPRPASSPRTFPFLRPTAR
jgi:HAE1 family hydrophobic/amphiphilic exporter-1